MRVVVTGGCGFLGRRVTLHLLERSDVDEIVLFDNAPSALPLPEDRRLRLVSGDIADRETVRGVVALVRARSSISLRWSVAKPKPTPTSATASISTALAPCSRPAARWGVAQG